MSVVGSLGTPTTHHPVHGRPNFAPVGANWIHHLNNLQIIDFKRKDGMADTQISRSTRLVTSQKLDDRFLTVQHLSAEDEDRQSMGELYAVIEIHQPWLQSAQMGSRIITKFKKAYYSGDSSSDLVNFENAIKQVNDLLSHLTEQGETEWIGNLNSVLALIVGRELHLASTGNVEAYLFREGKVSHVNENSQDMDQHPLKTFGTIISGTLLQDDSLLISNKDLIAQIEIGFIKECFEADTPYQIGLGVAKHLKKYRIKSVGALVVKVMNPSVDSTEPEVIYTDQTKGNGFDFKKLIGLIKPAAVKISTASKETYASAKKTGQEKIIPSTAQALQKTKSTTSTTLRNFWGKAQPKIQTQSQKLTRKLDSAITGIKDKNEATPLPTDPAASIIGRSIFTIHDYSEGDQPKPFWTGKTSSLKKTFTMLKLRIILLYRTLKQPQRRPLVAFVGIVILILSLILSISLHRRSKEFQKITSDQQSALEQAKQSLDKGKKSLVFGNKTEAQISFGEAIVKGESLYPSPLEKDARVIVESAQTEFDQITGTTRFKNLDQISEVSNALKFSIVENKGYTIDQNGKIFETGLSSNSTPRQVASLPGDDNKVTSLTETSEDAIIITTSNKTLYELKNNQVTKLPLPEDNDISAIRSIGIFGSNYYLLDPKNDQIWKTTRENNSITKADRYLKLDYELANSTALAIDGAIYVINKDGQPYKFARGTRQDFKLSSLPKPFDTVKDSVAIYADPDTPSIFILESGVNHRLIEVDKNGQFLHQYVFPTDFNNLKSLVVQPKGRRAFVLNGDSVYSINL